MSGAPTADLDALIQRFAAKYAFDESHAAAVAHLADQLTERLGPMLTFGAEDRLLLRHAATVHDVGYYVSGRRHHRHSAYLIEADDTLADYPRTERARLALLARAHRKTLPEVPRAWGRAEVARFAEMAAILRLADGLDYNHDGAATIGACLIGTRTVSIEVAGIDLTALQRVLRRKATLFAKVFGREANFSAGPGEIAVT